MKEQLPRDIARIYERAIASLSGFDGGSEDVARLHRATIRVLEKLAEHQSGYNASHRANTLRGAATILRG